MRPKYVEMFFDGKSTGITHHEVTQYIEQLEQQKKHRNIQIADLKQQVQKLENQLLTIGLK